MKCLIPGLNVKILGRAIHAMSRVGDELYVESAPHGLLLKTINSSESAYCCVTFSRSFFTFYSHDHHASAPTQCKISMRSALGVFKSPTHMDKQVEVCEIKLDPEGCKLVFTLRCKHAIVRTHFLSILDCNQMGAVYSKDMLPNRLSTHHKVLSDAVSNFQTSEDKVTVQVNPQTFYLRNYADSLDLSKVIRTQMSLKPMEFDSYSIGTDTDITFSMKEFRAVLSFAEAVNLPITLQFEITGKPAVFTIDNNSTFEADFVMATEPSDSATQRTFSTTQVKRSSSMKKKASSNSLAESRIVKKPHIEEKEDYSKCLDEESNLFNFIEMPDDTLPEDNKAKPNCDVTTNGCQAAAEAGKLAGDDGDTTLARDYPIPNSPECTSQMKRIRTVFKRCFEATMDPARALGRHAVLAADSDCEE